MTPIPMVAACSAVPPSKIWPDMPARSSPTTGFCCRARPGSTTPPAPSFATIEAALAAAGVGLRDVVRICIFVVHQEDYQTVARIVGGYMKDVRAVNTTIVCSLTDPRMKVEIEVTAKRPIGAATP